VTHIKTPDEFFHGEWQQHTQDHPVVGLVLLMVRIHLPRGALGEDGGDHGEI
jgi:hypothetical protein